MIKILRLMFLSLIIYLPLEAMESHVILKVNNQIITNIDLNNEYQYLLALNSELSNIEEKTILELAKESIIREQIKKNEILKYYNLGEDRDYLEPVIRNFYEKLNIDDEDSFKNYLNKYGLKLASIKDKVEIEILWNRLIGIKYKNQLNIKEEILKQKIEKNSNDKTIKEYELSEIIFQIDSTNDMENKISLIQKKIEEQGFKNTANIYSISESSKFGGSLGWINEKQLSQEINLAINKLRIGEISKPIKISNGFLILKIDNLKQKEIEIDKKKLLEEAILFETNKQYGQFSIIYYNKIKLNSIISEQ